jgi:hypothetical protein
MDRSELDALLRPESLRLLATLHQEQPSSDSAALVSGLRKAGHDSEVVRAVVGQWSMHHKAAEKFGDFAKRMLFSKDGLEQSTRLAISSHHARRFESVGITRVADLGCGIGGDSLAFAGLGLEVQAIEADAVTAALAAYNLQPFDTATVSNATAEGSNLKDFEGLWFDPARRSGSQRLSDPKDWSPSLDWVFGQAQTTPTGIKLAPGMDRGLIPEDHEAQWISYQGSVAEMVVWSGSLQREGVTRSALVLSSRGSGEMTSSADSPDAPVGKLLDYLVEPDGAVIRARLIGDLARSHSGVMLDETIAYFSTSQPVISPLAQCFRIEEVVPYNLKRVKAMVASAHVGSLEIKKRGIDIDPHEFRSHMTLKGDGEKTLILTRHQGNRIAILASRVV